jgi:hypothetical protein
MIDVSVGRVVVTNDERSGRFMCVTIERTEPTASSLCAAYGAKRQTAPRCFRSTRRSTVRSHDGVRQRAISAMRSRYLASNAASAMYTKAAMRFTQSFQRDFERGFLGFSIAVPSSNFLVET